MSVVYHSKIYLLCITCVMIITIINTYVVTHNKIFERCWVLPFSKKGSSTVGGRRLFCLFLRKYRPPFCHCNLLIFNPVSFHFLNKSHPSQKTSTKSSPSVGPWIEDITRSILAFGSHFTWPFSFSFGNSLNLAPALLYTWRRPPPKTFSVIERAPYFSVTSQWAFQKMKHSLQRAGD